MARGRDRSNFSVTCRMLSQYLKEKRSFGELGLEMSPRASVEHQHAEEIIRTPTAKTMSLLPGADVSPDEENVGHAAGRCVPKPMDLFPQHAGFGSPNDALADESAKSPEIKDPKYITKAQLTIFYSGKVLVWNDFPADKARALMRMAITENAAALNHGDTTPPATAVALPSANDSDMPLMVRRNSLHRFLEKRKDRIVSKAPYQIHDGSTNVIESKAELRNFGLGWVNQLISSGLINR